MATLKIRYQVTMNSKISTFSFPNKLIYLLIWGGNIYYVITQTLRQIPGNTRNSTFTLICKCGTHKWDQKGKTEMCGLCKSIANVRFKLEKKKIIGKHAFLQRFKNLYGCCIEGMKEIFIKKNSTPKLCLYIKINCPYTSHTPSEGTRMNFNYAEEYT